MLEAVILAGGLGTRLRDAVPNLPKAMAPVAGRPFLEILLTLLQQKGVRRVVLSLGHMADKVMTNFGSRFWDIELCYEVEEVPLGTGGATYRALQRCRSDHALVVNGDTYLDLEAERVELLWRQERQPIVIACRVADTARYGRIVTNNGLLRSFKEKGIRGSGLISAGYYVFPTDLLNDYSSVEVFSLERDYLSHAARCADVRVFISDGAFLDIGTPEDYAQADAAFAARIT